MVTLLANRLGDRVLASAVVRGSTLVSDTGFGGHVDSGTAEAMTIRHDKAKRADRAEGSFHPCGASGSHFNTGDRLVRGPANRVDCWGCGGRRIPGWCT